MASSPAGDPPNLRELRVDAIHRATCLYLERAYPGCEPPEIVRRRLEWAPGLEADALLAQSPFEPSGKDKSTGGQIYALRLGNYRYPHMKLQIQPWPNGAGYMLSVNTHDQVLALDSSASDMPAFRALQSENQRLKEVIEQAWDDAGLPTFLRYLREYIEHRSPATTPTNPPSH
jgi:hypothetical protein